MNLYHYQLAQYQQAQHQIEKAKKQILELYKGE